MKPPFEFNPSKSAKFWADAYQSLVRKYDKITSDKRTKASVIRELNYYKRLARNYKKLWESVKDV